MDVEELGRESNSSMFKEMYGLNNYPANWTFVSRCNLEALITNLSNDSREEWTKHYTKIANPIVHQTKLSMSLIIT